MIVDTRQAEADVMPQGGKPMWRCPDCEETIEAPLEVCWHCGTSRHGQRDPDFQSADELTASDTADLQSR